MYGMQMIKSLDETIDPIPAEQIGEYETTLHGQKVQVRVFDTAAEPADINLYIPGIYSPEDDY